MRHTSLQFERWNACLLRRFLFCPAVRLRGRQSQRHKDRRQNAHGSLRSARRHRNAQDLPFTSTVRACESRILLLHPIARTWTPPPQLYGFSLYLLKSHASYSFLGHRVRTGPVELPASFHGMAADNRQRTVLFAQRDTTRGSCDSSGGSLSRTHTTIWDQ